MKPWTGAAIGSTVTGFAASAFGADIFMSLLLAGVGAIAGIWLAFKLFR